jgi:beta-glucosidase
MVRPIPPDLMIGASTSAFQIEGLGPGRGETIWDRFLAEGGFRDDGTRACDHAARWREDVAIMAELGLDAYHFSVSWARVLPEGSGRIDATGLGFYDRLVDELLEHGITPWLTLYHWDLPQTLQDRGGWPSRDTVGAFADYAAVMTDRLGDRVTHWITINEPWVVSMLGHRDGVFAPGSKDMAEALEVAHHLLLGHGRAAEVIRSNVDDAVLVISLDCRPARPASDREGDVEATRHFDGFRNRWFFDPLFGHGYPSDMLEAYRARGVLEPEDARVLIRDGDLDLIATPPDVLGINYYTTIEVRSGQQEDESSAMPPSSDPPDGYTEMGWRIDPAGLGDFLDRVAHDYAPSRIAITENGASFSDAPGPDGRVRDVRRTRYLHDHLEVLLDARDRGVPVVAYLPWSLLDNLEWTAGFAQRFGLVHVDFATGERTIKDSARWLSEVVRTRTLVDPDELR